MLEENKICIQRPPADKVHTYPVPSIVLVYRQARPSAEQWKSALRFSRKKISVLQDFVPLRTTAEEFIRGSRSLGVLGLNPLRGSILCNPTPSEETINLSPNSPISTTHALICKELKDPGIPLKVVW